MTLHGRCKHTSGEAMAAIVLLVVHTDNDSLLLAEGEDANAQLKARSPAWRYSRRPTHHRAIPGRFLRCCFQ